MLEPILLTYAKAAPAPTSKTTSSETHTPVSILRRLRFLRTARMESESRYELPDICEYTSKSDDVRFKSS